MEKHICIHCNGTGFSDTTTLGQAQKWKNIHINGIRFRGVWVSVVAHKLCELAVIPAENALINYEDGRDVHINEVITINDGDSFQIFRKHLGRKR